MDSTRDEITDSMVCIVFLCRRTFRHPSPACIPRRPPLVVGETPSPRQCLLMIALQLASLPPVGQQCPKSKKELHLNRYEVYRLRRLHIPPHVSQLISTRVWNGCNEGVFAIQPIGTHDITRPEDIQSPDNLAKYFYHRAGKVVG